MDWEFLDIANNFNPGIAPSLDSEISYHIVVSDDEVLTIDGVHPWRPLNQDEWRWSGLDATIEHFLGECNGIPIFACEVDPDIDNPPGYEFDTLWSFLGRVDESTFSLIGRARQIVEWHRNHQHCGQCGKPTEMSTNDRSRVCHDCHQTYYPRLSPSIIVLVTRGEEILLAKNANSRGNFYSTLAGFIEPGESIEEAVHREVFEEVGIRIKNLQYFNSQSWPFPNSLMLGFHAEYDSGELLLQEEEIEDARWFHYTDLPNRPAMVSISGWLIEDHINRLTAQE
jgi:NAD+ diphosphatase